MENKLGFIADLITVAKFAWGPVIGGVLTWLAPKFYRKFQLGSRVNIPDKKLEKSIRAHLNAINETPIQEGKPLTKADMKKLRELEAHNQGITDLTGLEDAINLRHLAIGGNELSDLRPVAKLIHLEGLYAWSNRNLTDVSPLAHLVHLREIDMNGCRVVDLSPLMKLKDLVRLNLRDNRIADVSPLEDLNRLKELDIDENPIMDIIDKINRLKPKREDE